MTHPTELPCYRWPDLSVVQRQYVVADDQGRIGIGAVGADREIIWARPAGVTALTGASGGMGLPSNAVLITPTAWRLQEDGAYLGYWYDDKMPSHITNDMYKRLVIVDDLGWVIPDRFAAEALADSDQPGAWNYGATLGKVGGKPPRDGQLPGEMTVAEAEEYAEEVGERVTSRGIRFAANRGYIPGARKLGRDWLIPYEGFNAYLDNRPNPGPQPAR